VWPIMRKWKIFERNDFTARGEQAREELAAYLEKTEVDAKRFEEQRDRFLAREAAKKEKASV
ncbi:acyl-ACP desaturase, partial [Gordonia sp. HY442]|nr:acyl-ACP desaturase [Gordonia zhenghanii]MCF8607973.1 acyl-ACP desaturase [Gordonia zhenghanii]